MTVRNSKKQILGIALGLFSFLLLAFSAVLVILAEETGAVPEEGESGQDERQWAPPQIVRPEPDGQNGWYVNPPEITVMHTETDARTIYKVTAPSGIVMEGTLELEQTENEDEEGNEEKDEEEAVSQAVQIIPADVFEEGRNIIELRMVTAEGEKEVFCAEEEILLDLTPPGRTEIQPPVSADRDGAFFHTPAKISVKCMDEVSGVESIQVSLEGEGEQKQETIEGSSGEVSISPGFRGKISAFAVDRAGRQGEVSVSADILCEDEAPEITAEISGEEGGWMQGEAEVEVRVKDPQKRYGFASGLCSVVCSAGGKTVLKKSWNGSGEAVLSETVRFAVEETCVDARGIPVTVYVSDRAGNTAVLTKEVFIDRKPPEAEIAGVRDEMIGAETQKAVFTVSDENALKRCSLTVLRTDIDGVQEKIMDAGDDKWNGTARRRQIEAEFSEDGKYMCTVFAEDMSGRHTEKTISFIIDQTNPVIRYVEQLDGSYVPFFQWNYGREMIVDITECSYVIILNGRQYFSGQRITAEGAQILEVRARDQAGNESSAEAVFTIDNTPPKISWGEMKNGGVYDERAVLSVSAEGAGERLKMVSINGERKKLDYESRIFECEIDVSGEYTVRVQAEDLAGNQAEEEIVFTVEQGKGGLSVFHGLSDSFSQGGAPEKAGEKFFPAITALAAVGAVLCVLCFTRRSRRRKGTGGDNREKKGRFYEEYSRFDKKE